VGRRRQRLARVSCPASRPANALPHEPHACPVHIEQDDPDGCGHRCLLHAVRRQARPGAIIASGPLSRRQDHCRIPRTGGNSAAILHRHGCGVSMRVAAEVASTARLADRSNMETIEFVERLNADLWD